MLHFGRWREEILGRERKIYISCQIPMDVKIPKEKTSVFIVSHPNMCCYMALREYND